MKPLYIIGILMLVLFVPSVLADQQILQNNLSVSIIGYGNCSDTIINISIKTQGGTPVDYVSIPGCSNINEQKEVYFIGELECNNTVTTQMIQGCINYFNESCEGFPCQSSWLVCKSDLNNSKNELDIYQSNQSDIGTLLSNLTICMNNKAFSDSSKTSAEANLATCNTEKINVKNNYMTYGGIGIALAIFICWYRWGRPKYENTPASKQMGNIIDDKQRVKPMDES